MFLNFPGWPAGELSSLLDGRSDLAALKQGLRRGRNVIPHQLGGMLQRPGLYFRGTALGAADNVTRVKLLPFVATASAAYVLELTAGFMRFWRDDEPVITTADNVGRPGVVSLIGAPLTVATPYALADLRELQWCHANDVTWLAHAAHPVYRLVRYAEDEFYFEAMTFVFPPLRDLNAEEITLTATGDISTGGTVDLEAVGGDVFEAEDVGSYYGIDHRRETPFAEIDLSTGSGTAGAALSFTGNAVAGETTLVGTGANQRTYNWTAAVEGPYTIQVGGTVALSAAAFYDAINGESNPLVGSGTQAHPSVTADAPATFTTGIAATGTLTCTDNALESGSDPDEVITDGTAEITYKFKNTISAAYDVKIGATIAASLLNLAKAMNASGIAGTDYGVGTVANPDVTANETIVGNTLRVTSIVLGLPGNAIGTRVDHTSRLSWANSTLTGGADAATTKVQVTARIQGEAGNEIAVAETMTNASWTPTGFLTGGADTTAFDPANPSADIPTVRVTGTWEFYSLGAFYGMISLQEKRSTGEWETFRTWTAKNDQQFQATGVVDNETEMRLIFEGSAVASDSAPARAVLTAIDAVVHGLVLITVVTDATHATGTVVRAIWSEEATYLWARGSWSERFGYPSAVVLHQQRLYFGQGARLIASQVGGFDNFERTELADASWQRDLAATIATNIVSMQSQRGLIVLTENSEWLCDGGTQGSTMTPTAFRGEQLSTNGSARIPSEMIHSNVVFVQVGNEILNEYLFSFQRDNYEAVNLGELADHFMNEGLAELAYAPVPNSLLFAVTRTGSLLSLAYRRSAGAADSGGMLAWTKHVTPDASTLDADGIQSGTGTVESVCVVPGANEISDVWVCIRRELPDGSFFRSIESFDLNYWNNLKAAESDAAELWTLNCLDGAVIKDDVTAASPVVAGLAHLEGMTVSILLNGTVHLPQVVNGATVTIDMTGVTEPATAVVGLAPLAQVQPWFATPTMRDGGSDGRTFRVAKLNTRFYLSGAAQYADSNDTGAQWFDVDFRTAEDAVDAALPLKTTLRKLDLAGGYLPETTFIFRNQSPLPMNILAVTAEISIQG
jgi:hypothetical protein